MIVLYVFLLLRRPPRSTLTEALLPCAALFRSRDPRRGVVGTPGPDPPSAAGAGGDAGGDRVTPTRIRVARRRQCLRDRPTGAFRRHFCAAAPKRSGR